MKKFLNASFFILAVTFFLSLSLFAQDAPLPLSPRVTAGKLANGLTYYIMPNKTPAQKVKLS